MKVNPDPPPPPPHPRIYRALVGLYHLVGSSSSPQYARYLHILSHRLSKRMWGIRRRGFVLIQFQDGGDSSCKDIWAHFGTWGHSRWRTQVFTGICGSHQISTPAWWHFLLFPAINLHMVRHLLLFGWIQSPPISHGSREGGQGLLSLVQYYRLPSHNIFVRWWVILSSYLFTCWESYYSFCLPLKVQSLLINKHCPIFCQM